MPASVPDPGADEAARPRVATPTDVSAAIAERQRREARRRHTVMNGVAALLVLSLLAFWLVRFSPVFAARSVEVTGIQRLTDAQVLQAAQVPLDDPLVGIDSGEIGGRIANALAPVASVHVHTKLPHTVVVDVVERTAVYQRKAGTQYQLVDADGVIFALMATPTPKLAVVTTANVDNRLLASVATVVGSLPDAVRSRVLEVQATTPDQISLKLDKGQQVLWGSADSSPDKARVLTTILGAKATVFDVTSPGAPATR
mgnify:CR=1 FL=1